MLSEIWRSHYIYPDTDSTLEHHGIKGQKWGEKNGPPYPLKQETHDEVVNGGKNSNKSKGKGGKAVSGKRGTASDKTTKSGMSTRTKVLIAATAAAAAGVVIAKAYSKNPDLYNNTLDQVDDVVNNHNYTVDPNMAKTWEDLASDYNDTIAEYERTEANKGRRDIVQQEGDLRLKSDIEADQGNFFNSMDELEQTRGESTTNLADVVKLDRVNPLYKTEDGLSSNCVLCSIATVMRAKGYDVAATHASEGNLTEPIVNRIFGTNDSDWTNCSTTQFTSKTLENYMQRLQNKYPPNSYGIISVRMISKSGINPSCGHAFNWYTDAQGNLKFADGQALKNSTNSVLLQWLSDYANSGDHAFDANAVRLDDKEAGEAVLDYVRKTYD